MISTCKRDGNTRLFLILHAECGGSLEKESPLAALIWGGKATKELSSSSKG
jgi:hypothetical protein